MRPAPIPPAPSVRPPEISLRTLKSDLDALRTAPGSVPKPFTPEISKPSPAAGLAKIESKKGGSKTILIIIGVLVFGIVLALAGYFVIFPYFFPAEAPAPAPAAPTNQLPTANQNQSADVSQAPTLRSHQSLLKTPAESQTQSFINSVDLNNLRQILTAEASNKPEGTNVLKELLLSDASGQIAFSDTFPLFLSEFARTELGNVFEEDFTTLIYFDANGAWPAWIAKAKTGVDLAGAKTLLSRLETSSGLSNLFITSPGTASGAFKSGQIGSTKTRYLAFPQKGASLNYAWVNDKLIISTSFNGLKKIIPSL